MFWDNSSISSVVDNATCIRAATFLDEHGEIGGQSVEAIWKINHHDGF